MAEEAKGAPFTRKLLPKNAVLHWENEDVDSKTSGVIYTHEATEICVIEEGSGIHRILDLDIPCKKGDIYIVQANVPHGYFASAGDALTIKRLWFKASDWFTGEIADHDDPRFCFGVFCDGPITSCATLNAQTLTEVDMLITGILKETEDGGAEWSEAVRAYLALLLITVSRYVGGAIKNFTSERSAEWNTVSAMVRLVEERFCECDLTLSVISELLFVSKSYASKLFKRFMGESFADYLKSVRYSHAERLLTGSAKTVEEIVRECGMRDIPSFYHGFVEKYGVTPGQYRSNYLKTNKINQKGDDLMTIIEEIAENLQKGKAKVVKELVQQALDEGASVERILNEGLLLGMTVIGEKFKNNEVYVPEVLVAARAMNAGTQILKPHLLENGITATGKVCIGTVQGDLHDIGKNLVRMMMEGKGLEVIDLGTDVSPETFVQTAIDEGCQVICCSALLTTTMGVMEEVVKTAEKMGVRDKISIMIGGAPVNEDFCRKIGADAYTVDAASAADMAVSLCKK